MRILPKIVAGIAATVMAIAFPACSQLADSEELIEVTNVGAMHPLPDNGIRYGERLTGAIYDVDEAGNRTSEPVARVEVSSGGERGLRGLAVDTQGRTFAAWTDPGDSLVVGQVLPGPTRVVWTGPKAATTNIAGRLVFAPNGRLLVSVGDLQHPELAEDTEAPNGKLMTIDPDRGPEQRANVISRGWTNPEGIAYDQSGTLWVADSRRDKDVLARSGEAGPLQGATSLGDNVGPSGLVLYGTEELAVCQNANERLERYLIDDGVRAVPGRTVAENCSLGVIQRSDGTLAYATDVAIRTTS